MSTEPSTAAPRGSNAARAVIWPIALLIIAALAYVVVSTKGVAEQKPTITFVTADATPYWDRVIEGARAAATKYSVELDVITPDGGLETQNAAIARATDSGADGVAVSPVNPSKQTAMLRQVSSDSNLVTMDSDCELSNRVCFVGMDNYDAGRMAAGIARDLLPADARVLILSGPLDKSNGIARHRGVIDELLGRPGNPNGDPEPGDKQLSNAGVTVLPTVVDPLDPARSTELALAALQSDPEINCIIGLYGYHATAAADAVDQAGMQGKVRVVGFDAVPETLDAITSGRVHGVIAQDQFSYGYESVRILSEVIRGADYAIPLKRRVDFYPAVVTPDTIESFLRESERKGS